MKDERTLPRRRVLASLAGAAAAAGAAAVLPGHAAPPVEETAAEGPRPRTAGSYRVSEHVRQYYRLAKY